MTVNVEKPPIVSAIANPYSSAGAQKRQEFIHDILGLSLPIRSLWLPLHSETTSSTDRARSARAWTYDATIAARLSVAGSGIAVDFDGTAHEADTPDTDDLSFGDGVNDEPFSISVLCTPDVNNAAMTLLAKEGSAAAEEWNFGLNSSGHLVTTLTDESATATLLGTYATAVGTVTTLLGMSYDGSRAATGIQNFKNGALQTTAAGGAGSYVAMENTAALTHLGARYTTKERFFNGRIHFALVTAEYLTRDQHWALKALVNAYYNLSL